MNCHVCGNEIVPGSDEEAMYRISGWERPRKQGGANQIYLRKRTGERAHVSCILRLTTPKQQVEIDRYAEVMGPEAAERQRIEAARARGGCVCHKRTVKLRGVYRTLHQPSCPKWKPYMAEIERDLEERRQAMAAHAQAVDAVRPEG